MRYFIVKYDTYNSLSTSFNENQIVVPIARLSIGCETEITFIASVGGTKKYQGYARFKKATSNVSQGDDATTKLPVIVDWVKRYPSNDNTTGDDLSGRANGVTFAQTQDLSNLLDMGKCINQCRNFQEVDEKCGEVLCKMIDEDVEVEIKKVEELKLSSAVTPFFKSETVDWDSFLARVRDGMGSVLFAGHVGSQCFNLNVASSDFDMIVIAAAPTEALLGLNTPPTTIKNPPSFQPDYTIHEASHFLELLVNGDTRMVEQLFQDTKKSVYLHASWIDLQKIRTQFLTSKVVKKYEASGKKGVAQVEGMWKDMSVKGKQNDSESISKLMKKMCIQELLNSAKQIVSTGNLQLYMPDDSAERSFLLDVRGGKYEYSYLIDLASKQIVEINDMLNKNTQGLSDSVPHSATTFVSEWLLRLRLDSFGDFQLPSSDVQPKEQVKLLLVENYEPYSNPQSYIAIYSINTRILLSSPKQQVSPTLLEQAQQLALNTLIEANNNNDDDKKPDKEQLQMMEVGKFMELAAANSVKTAEILCIPKEAVIFSDPDWERVESIWKAGAMSSFRLAKKSVEVAKKLISGYKNKDLNDSDNGSVKFQFWRLSVISASFLQKRFPEFQFSHNFNNNAATLLTQMEQLLSKINMKDEGSKDCSELSDVLVSLRLNFL